MANGGRTRNYPFQSTLPAREATLIFPPVTRQVGGFQSTLPAREATGLLRYLFQSQADFNPRFPRGKRLLRNLAWRMLYPDFNPRFPRGKRQNNPFCHLQLQTFQSTLPAREATPADALEIGKPAISIHASREGSDDPDKVLAQYDD